ncbi:MAG: hypothetical protein ACRDG3_12405 [Tepidiformaceae bacterium]
MPFCEVGGERYVVAWVWDLSGQERDGVRVGSASVDRHALRRWKLAASRLRHDLRIR